MSTVASLGRIVTRALELAIVACLATMGLLVFGNVVLRYGFDSGIAVSEELARLLFVWLVLLGAILASRQHAHIGFDSLVRKLPPTGRKAAIAATGALMLLACGLFVLGGWRQTQINLDNSYPVLGISYAWLHASAMVFGLGMGLSIACNVWDALRAAPADPALEMTQDLGQRIQAGAQRIHPAESDGGQP
ncbi:MAG: TRAP transporter small permease [Rhodoferax sp.]